MMMFMEGIMTTDAQEAIKWNAAGAQRTAEDIAASRKKAAEMGRKADADVIVPPIHGNWTGADVRNYLPDVLIVHNARVVEARVCGRLNQFATVFIHGYSYSWQFAWDTIAHSLNTGKPLQA